MNDIIEAAERAVGYVRGLTFDQFASDPRTIDAVSYALVVIGEATKSLPETLIRAAPEIPWADVRGMRNRVAHEYFGVDVKVLWQTVRDDLPPLITTLRTLVARSDLA